MIVITTPTGSIGHQVLENVLDHGESIRVITREPSRIAPEIRARVEIVEGSHRDADVVDRAFDGADTVFWLVPSDRTAKSVYDAYVTFSIPAADAIVRHGVSRVVTVSALGRGQQKYAGHVSGSLAMEDLLRSTGVHLRALTMPGFMDNVMRQLPSIRNEGMIRWTLPGDLKLPSVATRDIAAVASRFLLDHTWTGQDSVGVLGPEDISFNDMAAILTEVLGSPIRYERGDREQVKQALIGGGFSVAMAQSMIDMDIAKEHGLDNGLVRTPDNSTPTTFRQWCDEALKPAMLAAV